MNYLRKKLTRRNFLSFSSIGLTFGFAGMAHRNKKKSEQENTNYMIHTKIEDPAPVRNRVLRLHSRDNVAVALENLATGTAVAVDSISVILGEPVAAKHKFALSDIPVGETIYLYGIKVGTTIKPVAKGTAITTENIVNSVSEVQRHPNRNYNWIPPVIGSFRGRSFLGYHRPDGQVGTANYWIVVPMVFCENRNLEIIKEAILPEFGFQQVSPYGQFTRELIAGFQKEASSNEVFNSAPKTKLFRNITGIQFLTHKGGCGETRQDSEELCGLLAGYITHPNVAGVTVLSLGCQNAQLSILHQEIKKRDADFSKPYFEFEQQKIGSGEEMIKQAIRATFNGLQQADKIERKPAPLSKLCVGVECGGSDGFSGISANPAVGHVADLVVALGGSVILSEFPELSGTEQNIYDRCTEQSGADRFLDLMQSYNSRAMSVGSGFDKNPSPGNIRDGLITDAMKSAGAAKKGGTSPITGVLDYPQKSSGPGLQLICTPGNDVESVTAEVASGANLVLFTTGLGTPTGNPVAPVIKISTNTALYDKMPDIIDLNAGTVIEGKETIEQTGERILNYLIEVASGLKEPAGIRNRQIDFIPWRRGVSL